MDGEARYDEVERAFRKRQRPHVAGVDFDPIAHSFERGIAQRHLARVPGLIELAPQIDARGSTGAQPARDGGEDGAAPATHVEHLLVAAKPQPVEDLFPDKELAARRRMEKARRVGEKERRVEREHRRRTAAVVPPGDQRDREAGGAHCGEGNESVRCVVAVVAAPFHGERQFSAAYPQAALAGPARLRAFCAPP